MTEQEFKLKPVAFHGGAIFVANTIAGRVYVSKTSVFVNHMDRDVDVSQYKDWVAVPRNSGHHFSSSEALEPDNDFLPKFPWVAGFGNTAETAVANFLHVNRAGIVKAKLEGKL